MAAADCIVHLEFAGPQALAAALRERGWSLRTWVVGRDDLDRLDPARSDLLIVLGGPMSVYQTDVFPWLADEERIVEGWLATGKPVLGSCMGAQLIARILGARVFPAARAEAGWFPITLTQYGSHSPLRHLANTPVLHWHADTFDLPSGAQGLASTPDCRHQAFSYGRHVLACQFHLEAEARNVEQWLMGHAHQLGPSAGHDPARLRADFAHHGPKSERHAARAFNEWLDRASVDSK